MPTPRHASSAAIDPVETVTPPSLSLPLDDQQADRVRAGANWLVLLPLFYAENQTCEAARTRSAPQGLPALELPRDYCFSRSMLSYSCRAMAARICCGRLAQLSSAGRRRSLPWRRWSIRFRAGSQSSCAGWCGPGRGRSGNCRATGRHVAHLGRLLVDVDLPGIAEILAGELIARHNGRKRREFERSGGMVGGNIVGGVRPLRIAGDGGSGRNTASIHRRLNCSSVHSLTSGNGRVSVQNGQHWLAIDCTQKKTARTFSCSCREASDANYSRL